MARVSLLDLELFIASGVEPLDRQHFDDQSKKQVSCFLGQTEDTNALPYQHEIDVYLSKRCQFIQDWMAKPYGLTIKSGLGLVERIGIEPMTPCLQSRCSPS